MARGLSDHILDHARDQATHKFMHAAAGLDARMLRGDLAQHIADQRDLRDLVELKQIGAQPVVDIMGVVGDVVGNGADLRLRAGVAPQFEVMHLRIFGDGTRYAALGIA